MNAFAQETLNNMAHYGFGYNSLKMDPKIAVFNGPSKINQNKNIYIDCIEN